MKCYSKLTTAVLAAGVLVFAQGCRVGVSYGHSGWYRDDFPGDYHGAYDGGYYGHGGHGGGYGGGHHHGGGRDHGGHHDGGDHHNGDHHDGGGNHHGGGAHHRFAYTPLLDNSATGEKSAAQSLADDYGIRLDSAEKILYVTTSDDAKKAMKEVGVEAKDFKPLLKLKMPSQESIDRISYTLGEDSSRIADLMEGYIADIRAAQDE